MLTVTAQQSRFHNEAIEGSALKDIIVKDLNIAIGQRDIVSHAHFHLQVGMHYVLAGRNGIGKSTVLKAIATEQIPSIPQSVRILLLGQTQSSFEDEMKGLTLKSTSVLQFVLQSDRERQTLAHEEKLLSNAMDNANDPSAIVRAFRAVSHERLLVRTEQARRIQHRRSGARGATARKVLLKLEEDVVQSQARLDDVNPIDPTELAEETTQAAEMLADAQARLEAMGASEIESKARTVLLGLGFSQDSIDQPISRLSGGWKTRCSLACALCQPCDLLLLDEPTNFLDLPSIIWLERYIHALPPTTTVILVSHDRLFADNVAQELLVLRNLTLERFRGNLSTYERERVKKWKYMTRMKDANEKQKAHMQKSIAANITAAKRTGDDKKLKQAASRKKKLDDRMGLEVSAKGTRFKLNRDLAGYHTTMRAEIEPPDFDPPVHLILPSQPADLRFPGALVALEKVSFAYGQGGAKKEILKDVDLTIHMGERVGIAGLNGAGKSTLVALALSGGADDPSSTASSTALPPLRPSSGSVTRHSRLRIGVFSQQAVEALQALGARDPALTALVHVMRTAGPSLLEKDARALLSGLGLAGRLASDVPLAHLSGGQAVRLALALVLSPPAPPPHLLVLDEVTTHLDSDTIEALVRALRRYAGALLVVTHDRFFMRCVVEGVSVREFARATRPDDGDGGDGETEEDEESESGDEDGGDGGGPQRNGTVYRLTKGKLTKLEGGMEKYEELAARASSKLGKT